MFMTLCCSVNFNLFTFLNLLNNENLFKFPLSWSGHYSANKGLFDLPRKVEKRKRPLPAGSAFFDLPLINETGVSPV